MYLFLDPKRCDPQEQLDLGIAETLIGAIGTIIGFMTITTFAGPICAAVGLTLLIAGLYDSTFGAVGCAVEAEEDSNPIYVI